MENKWGFIDTKGNLVVPFQFAYVGSFSEGLAQVKYYGPGHKLGFFDRTGKLVKEMKPKARLGKTFDGLTQFTQDKKKWGFVDASGKTVIAPRFVLPQEEGVEPPRFTEGRAAVYVKGKYGFINRRGKLVIAATFDDAENFSEGLAPVATGQRRVLIDKTGKVMKQLPPGAPRAEMRIEKIEIDGGGHHQH